MLKFQVKSSMLFILHLFTLEVNKYSTWVISSLLTVYLMGYFTSGKMNVHIKWVIYLEEM